ncbi:UDP-N-acetylmuramate--L-alanine ligase [Cuneatibacter sp. NSJ-177]|uniref:UDP-N-acetylmuramate--L-alanine ligase n=1 Tax=Cuneatibacter sp. NSJ-177 TaxID=2931401 RepID=UPI001FD4953E|nr:UDP-N-acetylmuramate--L-alanine ligase [Cuneatibacter sp. NSJ-177]MCJ7834700.1 UDP-N-acetylmuramate--L-alanine ligase [Cuneatibacter sp. NSJ-177]
MYQIDFNKPIWIHFIGIGGISMSGLAEVLLGRGFQVSGSDSRKSDLTEKLKADGARIFYGQRAANIVDGIDAVVYTAAVHEDNEEFQAVRNKGLPLLTRAELLGQMMRNYPTAVAIAGTHGKTTTTSMVTEVLLSAGCDPTISVGGMLDSIGGNIRVGKSGLFVTEACEYTNSFLSFFPTVGVILNICEDHLDFFKDIADIRRSFRLFAERIPEGGLLIIDSGIPDYQEITAGLSCRVRSVGTRPEDDFCARDITYDCHANPSFLLKEKGGEELAASLSVPGEHNVWNALAAAAVGREVGLSLAEIRDGLQNFTGTHRRFELKGNLGGITIVDDYAHHPDEIRATLLAAKKCEADRIVCVFQPHTYTRTKALMEEFADALSLADSVVLAEIYPARETDNLGISSKNLAERLSARGTEVHYFPSFDEIENFLLENSVNGDLLITMGAGDIVIVGEKLLGQ